MSSTGQTWPPPVSRCPACASRALLATRAGSQVNYLCRTCLACWHDSGQGPHRVDPVSCPGCGFAGLCGKAFAHAPDWASAGLLRGWTDDDVAALPD